jgi:arylsulfatase A-like enzyme
LPNIYAKIDRWTGEILDRLDPATVVIVLSDHGMGRHDKPRSGQNRADPEEHHRREGIVVVSGAGVGHTDLGVIPALDLCPTVLALLGLPLAEDMPGKPIAAVVHATAGSVPSYGDGRISMQSTETSPADENYVERLRALGYVQ